MATQQKNRRAARQPKVYADEQAIIEKMKHLQAKDELTDKQKEELKGYRKELGALKFKRLAVQRLEKAVFAVRNLGKLNTAAYTRTADQHKVISDTLNAEVKTALANLMPREATTSAEGSKKKTLGISL